MDIKYPFEEFSLRYMESLIAVFPSSQDGMWHVKTMRDNPHSFQSRIDLPESWAGKRDLELVEATGVSDAVFCHRGRFLAVAKSKEGAMKLAGLALEASRAS